MEPPGISSCYDPGFWQLPGSLVLCFCLSVPLAGLLQADRAGWGRGGYRYLSLWVIGFLEVFFGAIVSRLRRSLGTASSPQKSEHASLPFPAPATAPSGPLVACPAWAWASLFSHASCQLSTLCRQQTSGLGGSVPLCLQ